MEGRANPERPDVGQARWRTLGELVQARQYEQVVESLHQAQGAGERDSDTVLTHALAVACGICLACEQCRAEVEWHRQAHEEANRREQVLQQRLCAILDLIGAGLPSAASEGRVGPSVLSPIEVRPLGHRAHESTRRIGLWQRIRGVLRSRRLPQPPGRVSPAASTGPTAPFSAGGVRGEQSSPSLVVYCLGPFRVYQNDQLIADWDSLKARLIFKYLAVHRKSLAVKDVLMDLFWPDADPEAARRNLHQAIYSLRQTLRRGCPDFRHVRFEDDCYFINPETEIWVDSEEFERHVQAGRRLEAAGRLAEAMAEYGVAEGLYQGDFLEEDLYEDWPRMQREHTRQVYLDILDRLSDYYVQRGEHTIAIAFCRKALARDDCREGVHRRLMRCYLSQGQRHMAVRQYQACVQVLEDELGLAPSEKTEELYRRINAG